MVVATLCKLSPAELLHYLDNHHEYSKARLIRDIRQKHPRFEFDTESLGSALSYVSFERYNRTQAEFPSTIATNSFVCLPMYSRSSDNCVGGILDWDDSEAEEECLRFGEMTGHGLDWRSEPFIHHRLEIPTVLLDP